jgi:hypothetical protein
VRLQAEFYQRLGPERATKARQREYTLIARVCGDEVSELPLSNLFGTLCSIEQKMPLASGSVTDDSVCVMALSHIDAPLNKPVSPEYWQKMNHELI